MLEVMLCIKGFAGFEDTEDEVHELGHDRTDDDDLLLALGQQALTEGLAEGIETQGAHGRIEEGFAQACGAVLAHGRVGRAAGAALVMARADNGPFLFGYQKTTGMNDMIYRGGKSDHLEGGVRVNAFARWPAAIEPDTLVGDMTHVSDLYTTFARLGQATQHIPTDRIIDGVDQTSLFLRGEGNGRRDYVYIYQNDLLSSVVKQKFKMHMPTPGVPGAGAPVFDLTRDPREMIPLIESALWSGASFQDMLKRHMIGIKKFPHTKGGEGRPYGGITNLRPESIETVEVFGSWH